MNIKKIPDPKTYPILPPDMNYLYFEDGDSFPMEPENLDYSPVNAWWLAESAFLVYCHPGFARKAYGQAGFKEFRFFQGKGTEVMVVWNSRAVIVSFRGTEMKSRSLWHEILTDLNAVPVPFEGGGLVHKGFLQGLEEVWSGDEGLHLFLNTMLDEHPERPLWICGHSLGGALASLCFARLPRARGLYLYGSPRVGDQDFVEFFKDRCVWRLEHARDPVPLVPLDLPVLNYNYKDLGRLKYINGEGELLAERPQFKLEDYKAKIVHAMELQGSRQNEIGKTLINAPFGGDGSKDVLSKINDHFQQTRKEVKGYLEDLDMDIGMNMDDHQPIFYAVTLWNALVTSRS